MPDSCVLLIVVALVFGVLAVRGAILARRTTPQPPAAADNRRALDADGGRPGLWKDGGDLS